MFCKLVFLMCNLIGVSSALCQISNVSSFELNKLSRELFDKLPNNLYNQISLNYQGHTDYTNSSDMAPEKLINVSSQVLESIPTIRLLRILYNNYKLEVWEKEIDTIEENAEEDEFISALLKSQVLLHAMKFLANKGFFEPEVEEYRRILKLIWFHLYPRKKNVYGSSGFEHVYMAEMKTKNKLIGLHNWIYFAKEELNGRVNYLGYTYYFKLNDKADLASVHFTFDGVRKKSSMFIGTPPELEIALYTVCFYVKPGKSCRFFINGNTFAIQTYAIKSEENYLVASAYPRI